MAKQPSTNRANRGSSAPQDRAAKIQAVQKATSTGGANKIVIAGIVAILAIVFAVGGVIWNQKSNESDVAAGGNSVPAGASVDGGLVTNASVKLVDGAPTLALYEDFQCPNCKAFEGAFGSAIKEIADSGKAKVSYHILNFLDERGTNQSTMVANGAFCALDQGKFMEFHNAAYAGQYPEGDTVTLKVTDDGIGWTGTGTIRGTGLGSKIVRAMAKSLATELRYADTGGRGTQAVMELSLAGLAPPASEAA